MSPESVIIRVAADDDGLRAITLGCRLASADRMNVDSESSDAGPWDDDDDDAWLALNEAQRRRNLCHFCVRPDSAGKEKEEEGGA